MDRVDYQSLVIQDLMNLQNAGELDLSPWYQRRQVWNNSQKAYLINTIFEKKPIPAIYIRHSLDLESSKSIKEVVDGQQRSRTIISYYNGEFSARHPLHKSRVKFTDLTSKEKQDFLLTAVPVGYLLGATDADVIDIFGRINSVSKSLNSQEKRNAQYSGEMKQFCLAQASSRVEFWRAYSIFTANDIARMNETQFVADLVYNLLNGISDFSSKRLNDLYAKFDENFPDAAGITSRLDAIFDLVASLSPEKFESTIFKRQPLFFSLALVIDRNSHISSSALFDIILEIDSIFNSDENVSEEDMAFKAACLSTTQRLKQRRVRDEYISSFFNHG